VADAQSREVPGWSGARLVAREAPVVRKTLSVPFIRRAIAVAGTMGTTGLAAGAVVSLHARPVVVSVATPASVEVATPSFAFLDSLAGRSGKLRARFVRPAGGTFELPVLARLFGDTADQTPGVYTLADSTLETPFAFITLRPFTDKVAGRIGRYRIGFWPNERRGGKGGAYNLPAGFIEVTPDNADTYVSEHFRLRDFLTKDQVDVWPKYLVLDERLLDKLELVMAELNVMGIDATRLSVMSGFRTPQYNVKGVGKGGRAQDSRHQYGDAADVFVDNDGDGWMDDLNGDRRVDYRDAQIVLEAANRVEQAHPDLVGGVGVYPATRAHGPFTHIDVRGNRARWGRV
jgi:uncharacterized protein YcbK (DUF882 family)